MINKGKVNYDYKKCNGPKFVSQGNTRGIYSLEIKKNVLLGFVDD